MSRSMSRFDARDPRGGDEAPARPNDPRADAPRERPAPVVRELDACARSDSRHRLHARGHTLRLPAGRRREPVRHSGRTYMLRGSEVDALESIGRFRAVFIDDIAEAGRDQGAGRGDIRSLVREGLVSERTVSRLSDGQYAGVVSLTEAGKRLLDGHRDAEHDHGQAYYAGWVKPNEIWHDASLFRLYRQGAAEVEAGGGHVRRVVLEDELKARAYRELHRGAHPAMSPDERREAIAIVQGVPVVNGKFQFPDVRLEIETAEGTRRTVDLELVTEHYRGNHVAAKVSAGFQMYRGDRSRGGATPRDPSRRRRS
jgi:hypothetical protein